MTYNGQPVTVIVHGGESDWGVYFDGEFMAVLEQEDEDEDGYWYAQDEELDPVYCKLIGEQIEKYMF